MKTEKPEWLKLKELHDAEIITVADGRERPRSRGALYGSSENDVDQIGDGLIDVNHLMARFEKTGQLEELIAAGVRFDGGGTYGDFINAPTFEDALKITNKAREQFSLLSAPVRNRFENSPAQFLAFVSDPKNDAELYTMGLKVKPPVKEPEVTLKDLNETLKETRSTASKRKNDAEDTP